MAVIHDTRDGMLVGLRAALEADMAQFYELGCAAAATEDAAIDLFKDHLRHVRSRYELMQDAIDHIFGPSG